MSRMSQPLIHHDVNVFVTKQKLNISNCRKNGATTVQAVYLRL